MAGLLEVLVRATGAVRVLEIGTGTGQSGLEMLNALPPNGSLITIERDAAAAVQAREAFASAGLSSRATVLIGDAARYLHKIAGPFDLILQDGDRAQYVSLLEKLVPLLRSAGTLVTRNAAGAGDYNDLLAADSRLTTTFLDVGDGVALSVKR